MNGCGASTHTRVRPIAVGVEGGVVRVCAFSQGLVGRGTRDEGPYITFFYFNRDLKRDLVPRTRVLGGRGPKIGEVFPRTSSLLCNVCLSLARCPQTLP